MKNVYLDYNATTPCDEAVLQAMLPYFSNDFGNASSVNYEQGWKTALAIKKSQQQVSQLLNCKLNEIYFTSGATESNNWIVKNFFCYKDQSELAHIISSNAEHASVKNILEFGQKNNFCEVTFLPVNSYGFVNAEDFKKSIKANTKLATFIFLNNELGTINPIEEIGKVCRENKVYFHTDATQAVGKVKIDFHAMPIDALSFSGHKIYGPKGIGALIKKASEPHLDLKPLFHGGDQQYSLRAGTYNTTSIVGLGQACEIASQRIQIDSKKYSKLNHIFLSELNKLDIKYIQNGRNSENYYPSTINISFLNLKIPTIIPKLAVSQGSACSTQKTEYSHVLQAIGLNSNQAKNTLRFSFGRQTTEEDILSCCKILENYKI